MSNLKFFKNCPDCNKIQFYKQERKLKEALKAKISCRSCCRTGERSKIRIIPPENGYQRICFDCKKSIKYNSKKSYDKSLKEKACCRSCSVSGIKNYKYNSCKLQKYLRKRWRSKFDHWLKGANNGFEIYVGISLNQFKKWIESQFSDWMNWDNRGIQTWHIDHIRPLSSFNLEDYNQSLQVWNYKNLRPLQADLNRSKGNKL